MLMSLVLLSSCKYEVALISNEEFSDFLPYAKGDELLFTSETDTMTLFVEDFGMAESTKYSQWERWFIDGVGGERTYSALFLLQSSDSLFNSTKERLEIVLDCTNETRKTKNIRAGVLIQCYPWKSNGTKPWSSSRMFSGAKTFPDTLFLDDNALLVRGKGVVWFRRTDSTKYTRLE